jgi:hypothetical protein
MSRSCRTVGSTCTILVALAVGAVLFSGLTMTCGSRPALEPQAASNGLALVVVAQRTGSELLRVAVMPGDRLDFGWIHSVEHFPWIEHFEILAGGGLMLRGMRVRGFGAGIPHARSDAVRTEDGWIISSGIDEPVPGYFWINSHSAVGPVDLNGTLLFTGSDFPHHEALELRVEAWRKP